MKTLFAISILALLAGGSVFGYQKFFGYEPRAAMEFINAYSEYDELMGAEEGRVYVPGQGNNAARQKLNELLSVILTESVSDSERLRLAGEAQESLEELKREIDSAQAAHAAIYLTIDRVERAQSSLHSAALQLQSGRVIALMKERQNLTARITSVHQAINTHTESILSQIIEDKGALTPSHITRINDETAAAEIRFDELTRLYAELEETRAELEREYQAFVAAAL